MSPRILIVGPAWVGDMVMAQSLFITLKQRFPQCRIEVLAPSWSFPLLERMPEVADSVEMPLGHGSFGLSERRRIGLALRSRRYDRAIVLPNSWKSALIPWFARIPVRSGYRGELRWGLLNDVRRLDQSVLTMTVQRFVSLGLENPPPEAPPFPAPALAVSAEGRARVREKFAVSEADGPVMALCPGAEYGPAKRWPAAYFAELARRRLAQGWQVWLFGSDKDREVGAEIDRETGQRCRNFCGRTSLAEAVDLLALTDQVITNDSGLMHVAAALKKKLVAIYGSSDPGFTPPLNPESRILTLGLDCSPCFKRECPLGHTRCLRDITPDRVLAESELL